MAPATRSNYGSYTTLTGTLSAVATALNNVGTSKLINVFYDADNSIYVAVYHK